MNGNPTTIRDGLAFGLNRLDHRSPLRFAADAARLEGLGWHYGFIASSPLLVLDPYVLLAHALRETRSIMLGTLIENPVMRHPAVIAGSIATVDRLDPGRTILGMGVGDTAVRLMGRRPATVAAFEEAIITIRSLNAGERLAVDAATTRRAPPRRALCPCGSPRKVPGRCAWLAVSPTASLSGSAFTKRTCALRCRGRSRWRRRSRSGSERNPHRLRFPHHRRAGRRARGTDRSRRRRRILRVLAGAIRQHRSALDRRRRGCPEAARLAGFPPRPGPRSRRRRGFLPPGRRRRCLRPARILPGDHGPDQNHPRVRPADRNHRAAPDANAAATVGGRL